MSLPNNFELLLSGEPETCRPRAEIDPYAETRNFNNTSQNNPSKTNIIYRDTDSVYIINPTTLSTGTMTIHHRITGDKKYGVILQQSSSSIRLDVVGLPHIWIDFDPKSFSTENENKMFVCNGRFCQFACSWSLSAKCNLSSILCVDSEKQKVIKILDHGMLVASLPLI